jgi:large subunit ribosomal protein L31
MKKNIHPKYNHKVKVTCSCGNTFYTGSTIDDIVTELCSQCHPFYTGEQKIVDTENLVKKFREREKKASKSFKYKRKKLAQQKKKLKAKQKKGSNVTLKDLLKKASK